MVTSLVTRLHPMAKTEDFASSKAVVPADWSSRTCVLIMGTPSNAAIPKIHALRAAVIFYFIWSTRSVMNSI